MNLKDAEGRTCAHAAASLGLDEALKLLIKHRVDLNTVDNNGSTPLISASWNDKLSTVKLIIAEGVNVDHRDSLGATALSIVCQRGNFEIASELLQNGAQLYASARNPIKLAHQAGFTDLVKLLQAWSTMCYNPPQRFIENSKPGVPRNSKSVDSFRAKSARIDQATFTSTTINNLMRGGQEMTSMSYHISSSVSASPTSYDFNDLKTSLNNKSLLTNLNELDETAPHDSLFQIESKSSRFKQVKEKLLRKSTLTTAVPLKSPSTPGNKSVASFRMFIASLNGKKPEWTNNQSNLSSPNDGSQENKQKGSFGNSTFVQMIRRKLKFLKFGSNSPSNTSYHSNHNIEHSKEERLPQCGVKEKIMQRSVTDTIASSLVNNNSTFQSQNMVDNEESRYAGNANDDVAHIFNRNSLNDCLNPRRSYKESGFLVNKINYNYGGKMVGNSAGGTSSSSGSSSNRSTREQIRVMPTAYNKLIDNNIQQRRPTCLPLNYFKKETSI